MCNKFYQIFFVSSKGVLRLNKCFIITNKYFFIPTTYQYYIISHYYLLFTINYIELHEL